MVPIHLRTLRVASTYAKVQIPSEIHTQIIIFINSESNLTENKVGNMNVQAYMFCYRVPYRQVLVKHYFYYE